MNQPTTESADSSEESDQEYLPPSKKSKSNNSQSDSDLESESNEQTEQLKGRGDQINSLWEDFKTDTCPSVKILIKKANDKIEDPKIDCEKEDACVTQPPQEKVSKKVTSVPGKFRLNQLLKGRAEKKRDKPENILNSSKRDWDVLKTKEKLTDELTHHNKDGYLQRQDFLKRCEEREHDNLLESKTRKRK
eukprot:TRINITY_DN1873_c0_g1_i1.p2 TRINITY_DN1873_c0_g1~~TRINITY_DN1873_c0_g1_i1.p2  ORF type:complete len:191 (+),score=55.63 TRINITY_DN1873_c0_g1_i1:1222-1794(+)